MIFFPRSSSGVSARPQLVGVEQYHNRSIKDVIHTVMHLYDTLAIKDAVFDVYIRRIFTMNIAFAEKSPYNLRKRCVDYAVYT